MGNCFPNQRKSPSGFGGFLCGVEREKRVMGSHDEPERAASPPFAEMVVRTLRHEVGDLLQSVYSAVAILQERLPRGQTLERTILSDLRTRAESCKNELDAAHDLVCPLSPNLDWVDVGELTGRIAATFTQRFPDLRIECEASRLLRIWGDGPRLTQVATLLMMSFCQAAHSKIVIRAAPDLANRTLEWSFRHDGPPATEEQLSWLTAPFNTTRHARFGLGLAFARRVVELLGGQVRTAESPEGGFQNRSRFSGQSTAGVNGGSSGLRWSGKEEGLFAFPDGSAMARRRFGAVFRPSTR